MQPAKRNNDFVFTQKTLPYFFDSTGWNMGSDQYIDGENKLEFILYVPPKNITPLHILDDNGTTLPTNAFIIPQWGGIIIHNAFEDKALNGKPALTEAVKLTNESEEIKNSNTSNPLISDVKEVSIDRLNITLSPNVVKREVSIWITQMRQLLGFPRLQHTIKRGDIHFDVIYPKGKGATFWELDTLSRRIFYNNLITSKKTLESFSKMISSLNNIPIQENIRERLDNSIYGIRQVKDLAESRDYFRAKILSDQVLQSLESVFFDKDMVGNVQFTDEHYLAIYMPLFLPLLMNIASGLFYGFKNRLTKK